MSSTYKLLSGDQTAELRGCDSLPWNVTTCGVTRKLLHILNKSQSCIFVVPVANCTMYSGLCRLHLKLENDASNSDKV